MKLQVLQENLAKAVAIASRFTSAKAQLPVLSNILISASKTKLRISSTNLEISSSVEVGAKVEEEGEICVPSKVLLDLVGNLSRENVTLEAEKEQLKITTTGFTSSIMGMNASEFPKIPTDVKKEKSVLLPKEPFVEALTQTIFASSVDETRPVLTGVFMSFNKKHLEIVSTDGFRLSRRRVVLDKEYGEFTLILPKPILLEVVKLAETSGEVYLYQNQNDKQAVFAFEGAVLTSRLLEGEYPDYEKIIPKETKLSLLVDKEELLRSVKLAAVFARDASNVVKLKVLKGGVKLLAQSSQSGNQENKVDAKVEGRVGEEGGFEIAFNCRFLEEFLRSVKGDEVKVEFTTTDKAGVFSDTGDSGYLHLIMPVRV